MDQENKQEQLNFEARLIDSNEIPPDLVIEGPDLEAAVFLLEIPGSLSTQQIELAKLAIIKTLGGAQLPVAIARLLNNPTFGQTPIRIQLPKTSAARLILKFQLGDANVEPQDGPFVDRFGLPPAFEDFTGREESLALLEVRGQNTIIGNSEITDSTKKTVIGTGGIGKTQLAVTFAHSKLIQFQETKGKAGYRSIIWFIAGTDEGIDNQGLMTEQMQRLGTQLGFDPKQLKPEALIKLIYDRLEKEHGPYLVVFDNAQDLRSIQSFCPPSTVPVIVTTRNFNERDWGQSFKFIPLTVFTDKEAHLYIKKVLCRHHENIYEEKEANDLAEALGYFPLALTQALAYITNENMRITEYLKEFRQQKGLYLQEPVAQGDPYQDDKNPPADRYPSRPKEEYNPHKATTWTVIQLSLKKVINPNANQILKACAYLAPEVPIDINILSYWTANIGECREAVSGLRHYSLLENVTLANHLRIHQLVQEILKLGHDEEAQRFFLTRMADFMGQHYEKDENPLADEARRKILFPHCQAVLNQIEPFSGLDQSMDKSKASLQFYLGNIYLRMGNPVDAARYFQQALTMYKSLQDEIGYAKSLMNLGAAIGDQGDAAVSQAYLKEALFIERRTYGPDHPEVAMTLVNLGAAIGDQGHTAEAKALLKLGLLIQERIYGPEHHLVAKTLVNLGAVTRDLGHTAEAEVLLKRALLIAERTYGPKHHEVAIILRTLGDVIRRRGDATRAKALLERALAIQERTYGPDHHEVAKTLVNWGAATVDLGYAADSKANLERALVIEERIHGPKHPEVAIALVNLGAAIGQLGDHAKAKALFEQALIIQECNYDPENSEVAITRLNLALALVALGHSTDALQHLQKCYRVFSDHWGDHDPYTRKARAEIQKVQRNPSALLIQPSSTLCSLSSNAPWIRVLTELLEEPLLMQSHRLFVIARGCFDTELISEALALLDCIPEQDVSLETLYLRAECQLHAGEYIECRETLSICQDQVEEATARTLLTTFSHKIDQAQQQTKQWEAELNALKSKIALTMKDQMRIVILLRYLRRFEEALSFVNKIIATQPSIEYLAPAYFNQALCYFNLQRYEEALKSAEESYRLKERSEVQTLKQKIQLAIEVTPKLTQLVDQLAYSSRSALNL